MYEVLKAIAGVVVAWLAIVALAWAFQRRLIYIPTTTAVPPAGLFVPGASDVTFETADGVALEGWFVPAAASDGAAVVVFNGNAGDRSLRAPLARALAAAEFSVLLFDYRGYGGNPGTPSEDGLRADARAARAYLASRDDVDGNRIAYFGESLGCGVAIDLATEHPPAALVLRSPFTSLADVGRRHYPFLPVSTLLTDRFDGLTRIPKLEVPLLVIVGERDSIVPPELSRRLFEAALEPKVWVTVSGADHNDDALLDGPVLIDAAVEFLETWTARGPDDPIDDPGSRADPTATDPTPRGSL